MANPAQLPALLSLLEDDSQAVRQAVLAALASYGPQLPRLIAELDPPPTGAQRRALNGLLRRQNRAWLLQCWQPSYAQAGDGQWLEQGLSLLAHFLNGPSRYADLPALLDELAAEYSSGHGGAAGGRSLAAFLFLEKGLSGNRGSYYHPQNSNLTWVIEHQLGIPISLACVYLLVGRRVGVDVRGCNFPGHFLARVEEGGSHYFVDCYDHGRILDEEAFRIAVTHSPHAAAVLHQQDLPAAEILARVLRNLLNSFGRLNRRADWRLIHQLLGALHKTPARGI